MENMKRSIRHEVINVPELVRVSNEDCFNKGYINLKNCKTIRIMKGFRNVLPL